MIIEYCAGACGRKRQRYERWAWCWECGQNPTTFCPACAWKHQRKHAIEKLGGQRRATTTANPAADRPLPRLPQVIPAKAKAAMTWARITEGRNEGTGK